MSRHLAELLVGEYLLQHGGIGPDTRLVRRRQRSGADLWSISRGGSDLSHAGRWDYEPNPSSRDEAYLALHRYPSAEAALAHWEKLDAQAMSVGWYEQ